LEVENLIGSKLVFKNSFSTQMIACDKRQTKTRMFRIRFCPIVILHLKTKEKMKLIPVMVLLKIEVDIICIIPRPKIWL